MRHRTTKTSDHPVWLAVIIVTPFILFWRWLFNSEVLFWGTPLLQFWPWHSLVKEALLQGEWPLWNPLLGNGAPLLANLQSAVFYPPNLIYLLMPVEQALTLSVILHLVLAGLLMYAFARQLRLEPFPATISALAYMLSGYIIGRVQFVTMINAAAWLPLALLLGERLATRRRWRDFLVLAITLAIQFLAGHAQLWFYTLCLSGAYTLFRSWQAAGQSLFSARLVYLVQRGSAFALATGLSLLLAAVQLLPAAEFVLHSPRRSGAERVFALTYSFWPWRLITLLAPDFFGHPAQGNYWGYGNYWEDHAYLGVLPFILALVAVGCYLKRRLFSRRGEILPIPSSGTEPGASQEREETGASEPFHKEQLPWAVVPFFGLILPLSMALALGWNTPLYLWVFEWVPGFSFFQGPARLLIWYTLAMAALAGVGAQFFSATPKSRPNWRRLLAACVAVTMAGFIGEAFLEGRALTFVTATRQAGLWLILSISLLLARPAEGEGSRLKPWNWAWAVVLLVAVDLLLAAWPLVPTMPAALFSHPAVTEELLQAQPERARSWMDEDFAYKLTFDQFFQFSDFGPPDPAHWLAFKETLVPNLGVYAGLPSANNNDPLVVGRWRQLAEQLAEASPETQSRLLRLMHVGYVLAESPREDWPILYHDQNVMIQQVPAPLPRAYFASTLIPAPDEATALALLTAPEFEPQRQVILLDQPGLPNPATLSQADTAGIIPAIVSRESFNEVVLQVEAPGPGVVVLTDTYYPGWEVTVDGQAATLWPANLAFRAVAVEAGSHRIHFRYRPLSFTFGLWTSFITCLIIGGIVWVKRWRSRNSD